MENRKNSDKHWEILSTNAHKWTQMKKTTETTDFTNEHRRETTEYTDVATDGHRLF
jgi:hypothetical protein